MNLVRPRRSVLYVPGANARAVDKARTLAADGLILDLEDAVGAGREGGGACEGAGGARGGRLRASRGGGAGERALDAVGG